MKNKLKKIILVIVLIGMIGAIVFVAINSSSGKREQKVANSDNGKLTANKNEIAENTVNLDNNGDNNSENNNDNNTSSTNNVKDANTTNSEKSKKSNKKVNVTELETGTKYSIDDSIKKADIIVGDDYYDTQISDINMNFDNYDGKTIEIEGLFFENMPYTFVGRYSTSNLCPYCPTGYSYFEYEWNGEDAIELEDSESWIKIIGTLRQGEDDGGPYYYIDASSIEVKKEKGITSVSN